MRARFLAAMGLPASLVLACASSDARPDDPNGGGIRDDAEVRRDELPDGAWSVDIVTKQRTRTRHENLPTCPSGSFCVVGAREGAVDHARAPFDACPQSVPFPDANQSSDNTTIHFSANWTSHERKAKDAGACCYDWTESCPGGRPLRATDGAPILAEIANERAGWSRAAASHVRDPERAHHWARAAQYEHASVASFAQFSLQLLALGAPADLIARSHRAALDEIEHARSAFEMAAAFGHAGVGPGPLPIAAIDHDTTPIAVLRATVRDGCIAETRAARQARSDCAHARSELERDTLERIADDEERHAELAFATVAWLVENFGADVHAALEHELARLDAHPFTDDVALACLRALSAGVASRRAA